MKRNNKFKIVLVALIVLLLFSIFLNISIGTTNISIETVFDVLFGQNYGQERFIIFDLRLPRAITALLSGVALAISGAVMQGVTNNDLASPSLIGVTSGSALGVLVCIYALETGSNLAMFSMPFSALIGGVVTFLLVYTLSLKGNLSPIKLVLNGIGINSLIGAVTLLITMRLTPTNHTYATTVIGGSLSGSTWSSIMIAAPIIIILFGAIWYKARFLNAFSFGDEVSINLGVRVKQERRNLLILAVVSASLSAFLAGGLGFIGLIAPHIARRLVGSNYKSLIPVSALVGMIVMVISDLISRTVAEPTIVPIGIVVSIVGAPYMIYLLFKVKER